MKTFWISRDVVANLHFWVWENKPKLDGEFFGRPNRTDPGFPLPQECVEFFKPELSPGQCKKFKIVEVK